MLLSIYSLTHSLLEHGWTEGDASRVVCKRWAQNKDMPLHQIFDDMLWTTSTAGLQLPFADLGAAVYKRRHRTHPVLTTSSTEITSAVRSSHYAQLEKGDFCRGAADAGDNGSALISATNAELKLLSSATQLYFDTIFKVVLMITVVDLGFRHCVSVNQSWSQ